jgi:4-amino-4-deoxychorismate lyase
MRYRSSVLAAALNGLTVNDAAHALSLEERGLNYGDGVFETMRLQHGAIRFIGSHLTRLTLGCERLSIAPPAEALLCSELATLTRDHRDGIVKLIVTRGAGGRGYRSNNLLPTRIALLYPVPSNATHSGITVRWCTTRLARNAQLAGIKHLNRLEQVLAQNEWHDESIAEGLMLDTEGELICATAGNLFIVRDGILVTPDLRFSGIRGVMREQVIASAQREQIVVEERALWPDELMSADEVFTTNAVRGIRSIVALDERRWMIGPITAQLLART